MLILRREKDRKDEPRIVSSKAEIGANVFNETTYRNDCANELSWLRVVSLSGMKIFRHPKCDVRFAVSHLRAHYQMEI